MSVAIVTIVDISKDSIVVRMFALENELVKTSLCPHLWRGGEEEFEFGLREDNGTDIPTVHDDTFGVSHLLLLRYEECAHFAYLRDLAGAVSHVECADERFDIFAIERDVLRTINLRETHLDLRQGSDDSSIVGKVVTQGLESNSTVHGSCVHVGVAGVTRKCFGDR